MAKMRKFMVVHNNPGIDCEVIQANWRNLARVVAATWERTYYNDYSGMRYCVWLAEDEEQLKKIFTDMNISWESITLVEETVPDLWGEDWHEHLEAGKTADTLALSTHIITFDNAFKRTFKGRG